MLRGSDRDGPAAATAAATGAATQATSAAAPTAMPSCVVRPALTEGPYFVDEKLQRSDIRPDPSDGSVRPGVPLSLAFNVSSVASGACVPLQGTTVDVWHCDALGVYSDVQGSTGTKFLRGYQTTDASGKAQFTTVYPGWYQGRTVHIHFKIRSGASGGKAFEFTSQLFFDEALTDQVYAQAPYSQKGQRDTRNTADGIFRDGGNQLLLDLTKSGEGYTTTFDIGLNMA